MTDSHLEQPVNNVPALVAQVLNDENFSAGFAYLRGMMAYLDGREPTTAEIMTIFAIACDDPDVYRLVEQVSFAEKVLMHEVIQTLFWHLARIWKQIKAHDDSSG